MPEMAPSARSSGEATLAAIVSGLAPGSDALTRMVGKSTCGSGETGSSPYASPPTSTSATAIMLLAIGRRTKGRERFMWSVSRPHRMHLLRFDVGIVLIVLVLVVVVRGL